MYEDDELEEEKLKGDFEVLLKDYPKTLKSMIASKWRSVTFMALGFILATAFTLYLIDLLMRYIEEVFGQIGSIGSVLISTTLIFVGYGMVRKGWSDWSKGDE